MSGLVQSTANFRLLLQKIIRIVRVLSTSELRIQTVGQKSLEAAQVSFCSVFDTYNQCYTLTI